MCSQIFKYAVHLSKCINKIQSTSFRNFKTMSSNVFVIPKIKKCNIFQISARKSGNDVTQMMVVHNSRHTFRSFFDQLHFYIMIGAIPYLCIAIYAGVFVGYGELREIPEGYEPRYWEYYQHPITRWLIRYAIPNMQKTYEINLHTLAMEAEAVEINRDMAIYSTFESLQEDYKTSYFVHVDPFGANLAYDNYMLEREKGIRAPR